jgi:hypothetical protein
MVSSTIMASSWSAVMVSGKKEEEKMRRWVGRNGRVRREEVEGWAEGRD